jgi:hypothetical protein
MDDDHTAPGVPPSRSVGQRSIDRSSIRRFAVADMPRLVLSVSRKFAPRMGGLDVDADRKVQVAGLRAERSSIDSHAKAERKC